MRKILILLVIVNIMFLTSANVEIGLDSETTIPNVNIQLPEPPINYSIENVNRSDFWDNLDNPSDINVGDLGDGADYVPYLGSTKAVDLGSNELVVEQINFSQTGNDYIMYFDNSNDYGFYWDGANKDLKYVQSGSFMWYYDSSEPQMVLSPSVSLMFESVLDDFVINFNNEYTTGFFWDGANDDLVYYDASGELLRMDSSLGRIVAPDIQATDDLFVGDEATADWFKGKFNWTSDDDWNIFDGSILTFNESKLSTIYYNATQVNVVEGTIDGGNLGDTQHQDGDYDEVTFNFSEESGSPALDLRINFTNVDDFNQGIMRYKTSSLAGDYPVIQMWNYDTSTWEDYPAMAESLSFATIAQPVFDSSDHLEDNVAQMRIYKSTNGNTNNHYYIDWVAITQGYGTPSGEEVDPLSFHRTENLDNTGYNATFDTYFGDGSQLNNTADNSILEDKVPLITFGACSCPPTAGYCDVEVQHRDWNSNSLSEVVLMTCWVSASAYGDTTGESGNLGDSGSGFLLATLDNTDVRMFVSDSSGTTDIRYSVLDDVTRYFMCSYDGKVYASAGCTISGIPP